MAKKIKLFESPNHLYDPENDRYIGCFEDFTEKIKDITFFYYDNQFITGHDDHVTVFQCNFPDAYKSIAWGNVYNEMKCAGRCFTRFKILTFWNYPTTIEEYEKVINDLEKTKKMKIWNDGWRVEIVEEDGKQKVGNMWDTSREVGEKLIQLEDYLKIEPSLYIDNRPKEYVKGTGSDMSKPIEFKHALGKWRGESMKYLKKFEMCDFIRTENLVNIEFDQMYAFPFYVTKNFETKFGKYGHGHYQMVILDDEMIRGRVFYREKIVSFWDLEKIKFEDLKKLFESIQRDLRKTDLYKDMKIKYPDLSDADLKELNKLEPVDQVNFFDGEWRVDVDVDNDVYKNLKDKYFTYTLDKWNSTSVLVPITEFVKTKYDVKTNQLARNLHDLKAKDKWQALKDAGYKPRFKNWKEWQKPFESKVNECHFNELFEMRKEDLMKNNLQSLINQYDDEERAIEDFDWFYDELTNLNSGGYVYRVVFLPDLKYLNKEELGTHWTISEEHAKNLINSLYDMLETGMNNYSDDYDKDDYEPYIIEAKTEPDNIHFEYSMSAFCELPHEEEVNLKDEKKLKIISIKKASK